MNETRSVQLDGDFGPNFNKKISSTNKLNIGILSRSNEDKHLIVLINFRAALFQGALFDSSTISTILNSISDINFNYDNLEEFISSNDYVKYKYIRDLVLTNKIKTK